MPVVAEEHEGAVVGRIPAGVGDLLFGLVDDGAFGGASLVVDFGEFEGDLFGLL